MEVLLKCIIFVFFNLGDIVFDLFVGSFIIGVVVIVSGWKFIGIEINSEYIKMGFWWLDVVLYYFVEELVKVKKRKMGNWLKWCWVSEVDFDFIVK